MPNDKGGKMDKGVLAGIFLIALASLMYEILLTRLFSVTMFYHFAFLAVSIGLFGMTVGATIVCLMPKMFEPGQVQRRLAQSALLFSWAIVVHILLLTHIPWDTSFRTYLSLNYAFASLPFVFSGMMVSLALSRYPDHIGKLYATDLIGSALGCFALISVFWFADGPTAIIYIAALAALASLLLARPLPKGPLKTAAILFFVAYLALAGYGSFRTSRHETWLQLSWVKNLTQPPSLYEKWNSFSRLNVTDDWYEKNSGVRQLRLDIDVNAATSLTEYNGDLRPLEFLKQDISNVGLALKPKGDSLIVGAGGGRDVLSAMVFGLKTIQAVEINQDIIRIVNQAYGDMTGHLDRQPGVRFINDEARSYIARTPDRFDIIQVSLIDTWAATAAGAFSLTENALYTQEGWTIFFDHLKPGGLMTFTRWYSTNRPAEMYRAISLASATLKARGVNDPSGHIIVVSEPEDRMDDMMASVKGTILVSRDAFTTDDIQNLEGSAQRNGFRVILEPGKSTDETMSFLASGQATEDWYSRYPIDISPSKDDRPFFFNMLRFRNALSRSLVVQGMNSMNMEATSTLIQLLFLVFILSLIFILLPSLFRTGSVRLSKMLLPSAVFVGIGFGFMLIEMSQMQRLAIFLGHPTLSLAVVLFTLLLSSGLGSLLTNGTKVGFNRATLISLAGLLSSLAIFGLVTPFFIHHFQPATTWARIVLAISMVAPAGFFMGMVFPLNMKLAAERWSGAMPWFWGINGAASVCGSVLAVIIAMQWGISAAYWIGVAFYLLAIALFLTLVRPRKT